MDGTVGLPCPSVPSGAWRSFHLLPRAQDALPPTGVPSSLWGDLEQRDVNFACTVLSRLTFR